jgi:hypothetical protein
VNYLFGPQFLSNRGQHSAHLLKDKIVVDDDDDDNEIKHPSSISKDITSGRNKVFYIMIMITIKDQW